MRRRAVALVLVLAAAASGSSVAAASMLGSVTVQYVTTYSAASSISPSSCSSNPTGIASIDQAPSNRNKNFANTLTIAMNGTARAVYGLVKFSPCAPANAYVASATFFRGTITTAPAATRTWEVHPITGAGSWTSTGVTWNNVPAISATASASLGTGAVGSTMTWSSSLLTADVQGWVNGGLNNGWAIEDNGAPTATGALSPSGGTAPVLSIVYYR